MFSSVAFGVAEVDQTALLQSNVKKYREEEDCTRTGRCHPAKPRCRDYHCNSPLKNDLSKDPNECKSSECTRDECCQRPRCKDYDCKSPGFEPNVAEESSTCDAFECTHEQCCIEQPQKIVVKPPKPPKKKVPKGNCPLPPGKTRLCHFWGEPHFTHFFTAGPKEKHHSHRGHRLNDYSVPLEFHELGVYRVASQGDLEVQAFFCEGPGIPHYPQTSSATGLAFKKGTDVFQVIRDPKTKGSLSGHWQGWHHKGYWAYKNKHFRGEIADNQEDIFLNGERVKYGDLGVNANKNANRGGEVNPKTEGMEFGELYASQMRPSNSHKNSINEPVGTLCVGDKDQNMLVEWSVPWFGREHDGWSKNAVFEASVTVYATEPDKDGICGNRTMHQDLRNHPKGYFGSQGNKDKYQVKAEELIFGTKQMMDLCNTCNMVSHNGVCGDKVIDLSRYKVGDQKAEKFCDGENYALDDATKDCADVTGSWRDVCILEMCASSGAGMPLFQLEQVLAEKMDETDPTRR